MKKAEKMRINNHCKKQMPVKRRQKINMKKQMHVRHKFKNGIF